MHDGIFSADPANIDRWLATAGVVCSIAGVVAIAWTVLRWRRRALTPSARWAFAAALIAFPTVSMFLGTTVAYRGVKHSCVDCHSMKPWVDDMHDPASTTLAATHFRHRWINENACYTCHAGYGLAGDIDAKIGGVRHVWNEYVAGVPPTIRSAKSYTSACLSCHAETPKFRAIPVHLDPGLLSGNGSCFECHETPHPRTTE